MELFETFLAYFIYFMGIHLFLHLYWDLGVIVKNWKIVKTTFYNYRVI